MMTEALDLSELLASEAVLTSPILPGPPPPGPEISEVVAIESLRPADSPRICGEDTAHTRELLEKFPYLPAVLVNRRTMQVIDGMHRLSAARLAGAETIRARFVDTDERSAFLLAVEANARYGLPLSVADRQAAAERILFWYPYWSDRAIAAIVGLAATTVGAIRARSAVQFAQPNARIGRDGRVRPMSTLEGRRRASEIIAARPGATLREVAREAGISLGTAHNVRERMRRGEDCAPDAQGAVPEQAVPTPEQAVPARDRRATRRRRRRGEQSAWRTVRERLLKDPALRYTDAGRTLLGWFDARAVGAGDWHGLVDAIPPHWVETMTSVARSVGNEWYELAAALERRRTGG